MSNFLTISKADINDYCFRDAYPRSRDTDKSASNEKTIGIILKLELNNVLTITRPFFLTITLTVDESFHSTIESRYKLLLLPQQLLLIHFLFNKTLISLLTMKSQLEVY